MDAYHMTLLHLRCELSLSVAMPAQQSCCLLTISHFSRDRVTKELKGREVLFPCQYGSP